jgi:hypothetical protein
MCLLFLVTDFGSGGDLDNRVSNTCRFHVGLISSKEQNIWKILSKRLSQTGILKDSIYPNSQIYCL